MANAARRRESAFINGGQGTIKYTRVTGGTSPVREGDWAGFKFGPVWAAVWGHVVFRDRGQRRGPSL